MARNTFNNEELVFKNGSDSEQIRTRKIFDILKQKAINNEFMTEHEKDFFCLSVKHSLLDDGTWETYNSCDNHKFKFLYLAYYHNLFGYKKLKVTKPIRNFLYNVKQKEIKKDIEYLKEKALEWEKVIVTTNHSEELLQQLSKETRDDIKNLGNLNLFKGNIQGKFTPKYITKKRAILLHSKWIYCAALIILEKTSLEDRKFGLNGIEIIFNEYSLIHILNRHFAKVVKQFNTNKTFHSEMFIPKLLAPQLKLIFRDIDSSTFLRGKDINKIAFTFKSIIYITYINERINGQTAYRRLETFFPVTDADELSKLDSEYELKNINSELSVYVPIT